MANSLQGKLKQLRGVTVTVEKTGNTPENADGVDLVLSFGNGVVLSAAYWRLLTPKQELSSFDHNQQYGLAAPMNANDELKKLLAECNLIDVDLDLHAGDLTLTFADGASLQVFGFTGYEAWTIAFPDGASEFSNYCKVKSGKN